MLEKPQSNTYCKPIIVPLLTSIGIPPNVILSPAPESIHGYGHGTFESPVNQYLVRIYTHYNCSIPLSYRCRPICFQQYVTRSFLTRNNIDMMTIAGGTQVKWNRQDGNILASSHSDEVYIWDRRVSHSSMHTVSASLSYCATLSERVTSCQQNQSAQLKNLWHRLVA